MNKRNKTIFVLLVLSHLILVILALTSRLDCFFNDASLRKGKAADFFAVYQAGSNMLEGESVYLDNEGESTPYSYPFRYLPFTGYTIGVVANIFSPFTAYYVWILCCEILLGINIYLTWKLCKKKSYFLIASIPWLLFTPYLIEVFMGQWTFLLTSLLFYSMYGLLKNSKFLYSFLITPIIKPNALIIAPLFLRHKKIQLLFLTGLSILFTSIPYFLFFKEDVGVFLRNFQDAWYSHGGNLGFKSLYYLVAIKYISVPWPRIWFFGFMLVTGLLTLYLTFKSKNKVFGFTLWICYYFLIYKDVWEHHYVLLMPAFALIISQLGLYIKNLLTKKHMLIILSFLLIALPTIFPLQYLFRDNVPIEPDELSAFFVIPYHSIKILGVIILYIWTSVNIKNEKER
ncbi:hypothetical protein JW766_04255 [Candidatus Dojkabacteria bacterium]|nr:hypothetical protein [Candidatus Dojkabacteria bacterium]